MKESETYGEINSSGKLKIFKRDEFMNSLKLIYGDSEAKSIRVKVIVKKLYRKRSNPQNQYYWGIVVNDFVNGFKETTGETITPTEAHELLKSNCNYMELSNESTGEILRVGRSTTTLSTVEMEEYLERCRQFNLEWFGIVTLLPNQQSELMFT